MNVSLLMMTLYSSGFFGTSLRKLLTLESSQSTSSPLLFLMPLSSSCVPTKIRLIETARRLREMGMSDNDIHKATNLSLDEIRIL